MSPDLMGNFIFHSNHDTPWLRLQSWTRVALAVFRLQLISAVHKAPQTEGCKATTSLTSWISGLEEPGLQGGTASSGGWLCHLRNRRGEL